MRILKLGNEGSITVEMCMVMPIVIWVLFVLIFLLVRGANEGVALGNCQVMAYVYSDLENREHSADENTYCDMVFDWARGSLKIDKGSIVSTVTGMEDEAYSIDSVSCEREWDVCTDRLRRWQLYGDILWE